jgi:hypothetical protein
MNHRNTALLTILVLGLIPAAASSEPAPVWETTIVESAFKFDTGVLRGHLRHGGGSLGLVPMHHAPSDTPLANIPGIYNHYRVFGANRRYVESMRALPSSAVRVDPQTVRAHWDAGEENPFTMDAVYAWVAADTIDLTTTVIALEDLPAFEVFLSTYCGEQFKAAEVYVKRPGAEPGFAAAEPMGTVWQMFPRDDDAAKLIQDGRWTYPPSPVDWAIRWEFAAPLLYRRAEDTGAAIVLMARAEDCFAVSAPERDEAHYSMYFSLFGRDVAKGETVSARTRLVVGVLDEAEILARYREFLDSMEPQAQP